MISIDTIRLRLRRPVINPDAGLVITPLPQRLGLETISRGRFIYTNAADGQEHEVREVDIHQDFIHIMSKSNYLMITLHMPQVAAQDVSEYRPLTREQAQEVFEHVQDWCST